jgi:fido (protein-threonine AMPylation protein)
MAKSKGHAIQWSNIKDTQYNGQKERTHNTMAKSKGHAIQWSKVKDTQYNDQK